MKINKVLHRIKKGITSFGIDEKSRGDIRISNKGEGWERRVKGKESYWWFSKPRIFCKWVPEIQMKGIPKNFCGHNENPSVGITMKAPSFSNFAWPPGSLTRSLLPYSYNRRGVLFLFWNAIVSLWLYLDAKYWLQLILFI